MSSHHSSGGLRISKSGNGSVKIQSANDSPHWNANLEALENHLECGDFEEDTQVNVDVSVAVPQAAPLPLARSLAPSRRRLVGAVIALAGALTAVCELLRILLK
jgi:hypothetical protein